MSIFHIPEIVTLVGPHLSTRDLFHFCLVNKIWNASFTPYLWQSLPSEPASPTPIYLLQIRRIKTWARFYALIEADILYEQHHFPSGENGGNGATAASFDILTSRCKSYNTHFSLPALTRNGHWIRALTVEQSSLLIPYPPQQYRVVSLPPLDLSATSTVDTTQIPRHRHHHNLNPQFATPEILLHVFKRCPNLHTLKLIGTDIRAAEFYFWKRILTVGLPSSIKELDIELTTDIPMAMSTILPMLFRQCSPALQKLSIMIVKRYTYVQTRGTDIDTKQDIVDTPLPVMKDLSLKYVADGFYPPSAARFLSRCVNLETLTVTMLQPTWISAMKACHQLRRLRVNNIVNGHLSLLAIALVNSLPSLDALHLGLSGESLRRLKLVELVLATVLSAGRAGWRSLNLPLCGKASADALVRHCSTLEELELKRMDGVTGQHLYQILSTSPWLVKFDVEVVQGTLARISAEDFIDLDPFTDSPTPWPCESSLRVFRARIGGIPRSAACPPRVPQVRSPGQVEDIQRHVYKRLSRLTHLERLELGVQSVWHYYSSGQMSQYQEIKDKWGYHLDCLPMTLQSGLQILKPLTELRELNVSSMDTAIGVKEVKWMVQSWPRLKAVKGLTINYRGKMEQYADRWLRTNHPRIHLEASMDACEQNDSGNGTGGAGAS